jgi:hypothetical protein
VWLRDTGDRRGCEQQQGEREDPADSLHGSDTAPAGRIVTRR